MEKYISAWNEMIAIVRDFINAPKIKNAFLWGFALYAIALFALIRGDIFYNDDWKTSVMDMSWNHNSRYLATFILNDLATLGKGAVDSSPLLQILGVCLVVASSLILIYLIRGKFDLLGIVASLPLGLSPHFLQNLSYKFDSLTMGFALFLAIAPFLFKENKRIFSAVSVICLILMFMTYQAANGTYIILSLYFAFSLYFLEGRNFKESAIFLAICGANLIIASAIYKLVLIEPISSNAYASDAMIVLGATFFADIWANLATYLSTIFNDFKQTPYIWLVALSALLFVINMAIRTNRNKIIAICGAILFLALGICLSYGLYLVLQKPLFEPRAFYGFNAFVAILCIANVDCHKNFATQNFFAMTIRYVSATIAIITAYFLISFANIYGNALKKQDEYLDFRAQLLLKDLSDKVPKDAMVNLKIHLGYSAVTKRFAEKYGDTRLVKDPAEYYYHFYSRLQHLNAPYNLNETDICDFIKENFNGEVIFKNAYHTIERAKVCYIVTLSQ